MTPGLLVEKPPASVAVVESATPPVREAGRPLDPDSRAWLDSLRSHGADHEEALARLHALLLRAARFEATRRRVSLPHVRPGELDDVAQQAADDALVAILARLDSFRGESRFTTWAYKFALFETAVKLRKLAWQGREIPLVTEDLSLFADPRSPDQDAERSELLRAVQEGIREALTPRQRDVLLSLVLNEVPIDVLAERLGTTRGALYKTLHDARRKLRTHLAAAGLAPTGLTGGTS
jgi:RNA polymerase sigma-70 factor, ECF subfamily